MLKLINLKKSFNDQEILKNVSFSAKGGELTVLMGDNGSGKSTLFNIISGVLEHDLGEIWLLEKNIGELSAIKRSKYIGILKQDPKSSSVSILSVMDNLLLALLKEKKASLKGADSSLKRNIIREHLNKLGLSYLLNFTHNIENLSGGQRQILAFAMATINEPKLLLLDEPTAALDEKSSHLLMNLVKEISKESKIPALLISHDQKLSKQYADKILVLNQGLVIDS